MAANAYVGPQVNTYVRRLEGDLAAKGFRGSLFMMGSNGGLLSVDRTCRQPVGLVESGPIGGCIGAAAYADALGYKNVVAFDMGGTTAKCALVENGQFSVDFDLLRRRLCQRLSDQVAGHQHRRGRLRWRLDRLARSSRTGFMSGRKAPARRPGPACYGRGGTRADRDRRQSRARPPQCRPLPRRRVHARCRGRARVRSSV